VEILVFCVGQERYGVNVAKVREVRVVEPATYLPQYPDGIEGVVRLRDRVVPVVDLQKCLWGIVSDSNPDDRQLFLEFNNQLIAFRVQSIDRIYRLSWKDVIPLPPCSTEPLPATGVVLVEGRIILVLDFEWLTVRLGISGGLVVRGDVASASPTAAHCPLVFADDSQLVRKLLHAALNEAGYSNVKGFTDGQEAWEYLEHVASKTKPESLAEHVCGVVSDIEMPRMDGLTLTRRIRENPVLKDLPVILFSSLISEDNEKKGKQVGATAQISKPRWDQLGKTLEETLGKVLCLPNRLSAPRN